VRTLTGNRNDITQVLDFFDQVPPVRDRSDGGDRGPTSLFADRGYDHDKRQRLVWKRGTKPVIARRQSGHYSRLEVSRTAGPRRGLARYHGLPVLKMAEIWV